jgi:hypothetical protein
MLMAIGFGFVSIGGFCLAFAGVSVSWYAAAGIFFIGVGSSYMAIYLLEILE